MEGCIMKIKVTSLRSPYWERIMPIEEAGDILATGFRHSDNGRQTGQRIIRKIAAVGRKLTIKNNNGAFKFEAAN